MAEGPLIAALGAKDAECLRPVLSEILKAEIGPIRLEQTAGERFTGGKSTPIWKLTFSAKRGQKEKETRLVAKWVQPSTDFRRKAYANERQFYLNAAPLVRKSCRLPHLLLSDCKETTSGFCFLLDDLTVDFPLHPDSLGRPEAHAALRWLAGFHARFWEADAGGSSFPSGLASSADYWGLAKGDNEERLANVAGCLNASSKVLKAHDAWEVARSLGPRLAAAARPLDAVLRRAKGFVRHRTLLHGDYKTANMFLRPTPGASGEFEAAVVDFEFAGPGLVAVDLANFLFPDLRMNLLDVEEELLAYYHTELQGRLDEAGIGGGDFSLELLRVHYALARCDYTRYMLGRGWTACAAADARLLEATDRDLRRLDGGQLLSLEEYERQIVALLGSC